MGLESVTHIADLVPTNPVNATDQVAQGDDHIRNIKLALKTDFANITDAVTATHTELNYLDGATGVTGTGNTVRSASPTFTGTISAAAFTGSGQIVANSSGASTSNSAISISAAAPFLNITETDQAADATRWLLGSSAGVLHLGPVSDAATGPQASHGIRITRSGTTATEVELNGTDLDFNGNADFSGTLNVVGALTGTAATITGATGILVAASTTTPQTVGGQNANLQVQGTSNATASIVATRWNNSSGGGRLILGASRGGIGTATILQDTDVIGRVDFAAADGTDMATIGATIRAVVSGTPGADDMPTSLIFATTADGAATVTDRLTISNTGLVTTGNSAGFTIGGTGETLATFVDDGACTLYYDNSAKFATTSAGVSVTGTLIASSTATVGTGSVVEGAGAASNLFLQKNGDSSSGLLLSNDAATAYLWNYENTALGFATNNSERLTIANDGGYNFRGGTVTTSNTSASEVGYKGTPQNGQNGNYTLVLADAGKTIYKSSGGSGETITIPPNGGGGSVAFPVGTIIRIVNNGGGTLTIAITTDTLSLAGSGDTSSRTLADHGVAVIEKVASTEWFISGVGLS